MADGQDILAVGKFFDSFEALDSAISRYERIRRVQFYRRSSRSLAAYSSRCPKRQMNPELKYSEIDYACVHGGKKFKSKSTGIRPNTSTSQMECPAVIKLRSSMDGQHLVIKTMNDQHNHGYIEQQGKPSREKYLWSERESLPSMAVGFHWSRCAPSSLKLDNEEVVTVPEPIDEGSQEPVRIKVEQSCSPQAPPPLPKTEVRELRMERERRTSEQAFGDMVAHELEQIYCKKVRQKAKLRIQEVLYQIQCEADDF